MTCQKVVSPIVANNPKQPSVILIHGLYQKDWAMRPLAHRLKQLGFVPYLYHYDSLKSPLSAHSQRLLRFINHAGLDRTHIIAHSLGGLVVRQFLLDHPAIQLGRIVTLGTPHQGSTVAHYVKRLIPTLIGQVYHNALDGRLPDHQTSPNVELGVIAGSKAVGIGQPFLSHYHKKHPTNDSLHDGTVLVSETRLSWAKDHIIVPASHTGMLLDLTVAKHSAYFLEHGCFDSSSHQDSTK
ncbi:MAG: alpha/beta hydrolase [Moraxella sp.]|nr:alpha/beta hydrolase [Moraxella sp.]